MQHKGKAETVEVSTDEYEAGDFLSVEVGDWNGSGYSYSANGNGQHSLLVIEAGEDALTVIFAGDRLDWAYEDGRALEFTVHADGFLEGDDLRHDNSRLKSIEKVEGRSGYHKVARGIERTRDGDDDSENDEEDTEHVECPNCGGDDIKQGAAVETGRTFDYGCRDCRTVFDHEDAR